MRPEVRGWIEQRGDPAEIDAFNAYVGDAAELYHAAGPWPGVRGTIAAEADFISMLCTIGHPIPGVPDDVVERLRADLWQLLAVDAHARHIAASRVERWTSEAAGWDDEPPELAHLRRMVTLADAA